MQIVEIGTSRRERVFEIFAPTRVLGLPSHLKGRTESFPAQTRVIAVALAAANPPLGFNQPVHGRFERHARRLLPEVREGEPDGIGHRPPIVATPGDLIQEKTALKPFA